MDSLFNEKLKVAMEDPKIKMIVDSEEFYFQKAMDKFLEFKEFDAHNIDISKLIDNTKVTPFSFSDMLISFQQSSDEYKLLTVIGKLISYFDKNAAMKNLLNEFSDKRTIALAGVRQNIWVEYLLKFKSGIALELLPEVVRNALIYIENPESNIAILSETRRKTIYDAIFEGNNDNLFNEMRNIGIIINSLVESLY